ncbi:MAG: amidohydrolase family protein [Nitrospinota bacterium]
MDLLIRNALLRGAASTVDIAISGGRIERVRRRISGRARRVIDARGGLTTPAFVNAHTHLDKCMLGELKPNVSGTFDEAIRNTLYFRKRYTVAEIAKRAAPVVDLAVRYGSTFLRLFADVGTIGGLTPVKGMLELKKRCADVIDIEVVAFPQEGIICDPGTEDLMRDALELGADVAGGIPWFERTDEDARAHIDVVFELAEEFRTPIHMLVDDTDDPNSRSLESLAVKVLKSGFRRPVTVSHAEAMASWNNSYADKVLRLCKQAGIHFSCNSHINLMLNGRFDKQPIRRGIMRVREMLALGINILSAQDDVMDLYYPFGRMNQLEVAWCLGHAIMAQTPRDIEFLYDAVTANAAKAMGLKNYGIAQGRRADLVVIDQPNVKEAIRFMGPILYTVRGGSVTWDKGRIVRGKGR